MAIYIYDRKKINVVFVCIIYDVKSRWHLLVCLFPNVGFGNFVGF